MCAAECGGAGWWGRLNAVSRVVDAAPCMMQATYVSLETRVKYHRLQEKNKRKAKENKGGEG